ncbi:MAG: hypothetical protein AAFV54_05955, partial [Pseudomonadota bacterium]
LMIAAQFVGVPKPIDGTVAVETLDGIIEEVKKKERAIAEIKIEELNKKNLVSKKQQKIRADNIIKEIEAEANEAKKQVDRLSIELANNTNEIEKLKNEILAEKVRIKSVEYDYVEEIHSIKGKAYRPYFFMLTALLIVVSNRLGMNNFTNEEECVMGLCTYKWIVSCALLISCVAASYIIARIGTYIFRS